MVNHLIRFVHESGPWAGACERNKDTATAISFVANSAPQDDKGKRCTERIERAEKGRCQKDEKQKGGMKPPLQGQFVGRRESWALKKKRGHVPHGIIVKKMRRGENDPHLANFVGMRLYAEGGAAAASALDVGIVELEAGALDGFDVIDGNAVEVHFAHLVDEDFQAVEFVDVVAILVDLAFEGHVIAEARAASADDGNAQARGHRRLLRDNFFDLGDCDGR